MSDPSSSEDLKLKVLLAIEPAGDKPAPAWLVIWNTFLSHPWYQHKLEVCARRALRQTGAPNEWLDDVKQDVALLLGKKLRRKPDLGLDRAQADKHFEGWLSTIITRDCRQSLRSLRRLRGAGHEAAMCVPALNNESKAEDWMDLYLLVDQLSEPYRTVMGLHLKAWSLDQIASSVGLSYWQTQRAVKLATAILKGKLGTSADRTSGQE